MIRRRNKSLVSTLKPGGLKNRRDNVELGPPALAAALASLVGGMGSRACSLRPEGD